MKKAKSPGGGATNRERNYQECGVGEGRITRKHTVFEFAIVLSEIYADLKI